MKMYSSRERVQPSSARGTEDFQIFATRLKRKMEKRDPVRHFLPFTQSTV